MEATQQGGNFVVVMDEDGNPQILHRFEGVVMPTTVPSVVMSRWQTFLFPGWYLLIEPLKGAIMDGTGVSGPQPMHRAVLDDGLMELAPQIVDCNIWFKVELMRLYPQFEAFDPEAAWEDMAKNIAQSPVPAEESEYMVGGRGPGPPPPMDGPSCMVLNDARPPPLWGGPGGLGAGLQEKVVKFLRKY